MSAGGRPPTAPERRIRCSACAFFHARTVRGHARPPASLHGKGRGLMSSMRGPEAAMDTLALALTAWIGAHGPYEVDGIAPPLLLPMSPQSLTAEFCTGVGHLMPDDGIDERIN